MRPRPRLLVITLLATMLFGSALAEGEAEPVGNPDTFNVLAGSSITCSTAWPSATVGCWWERPVLVLGALELAIGLDAQATLSGSFDDMHLAPYAIGAFYADGWSAWVEVRLPELGGIPVLGSPDWLRIGFTYRIPP